ncbi:hypothetical protein ACFYYM_34260 [Streptomyces erythrochromogenes]|uniref:hypothetical protein n=1 Tax=Streptomyces erythrochromogenes TaxID=285574 RepID=UPI00367E3821
MNDILSGSLAEFIGGLAVALALAGWVWIRRRHLAAAPAQQVSPLPRQARRYTLLDTPDEDGQPQHLVSTRPAGTVVTRAGASGPQHFELTDAVLPDGSYAAEPLHRFQ